MLAVYLGWPEMPGTRRANVNSLTSKFPYVKFLHGCSQAAAKTITSDSQHIL